MKDQQLKCIPPKNIYLARNGPGARRAGEKCLLTWDGRDAPIKASTVSQPHKRAHLGAGLRKEEESDTEGQIYSRKA